MHAHGRCVLLSLYFCHFAFLPVTKRARGHGQTHHKWPNGSYELKSMAYRYTQTLLQHPSTFRQAFKTELVTLVRCHVENERLLVVGYAYPGRIHPRLGTPTHHRPFDRLLLCGRHPVGPVRTSVLPQTIRRVQQEDAESLEESSCG